MEIQFAIVRSENREYLCYKAGEAYVDASNPMMLLPQVKMNLKS